MSTISNGSENLNFSHGGYVDPFAGLQASLGAGGAWANTMNEMDKRDASRAQQALEQQRMDTENNHWNITNQRATDEANERKTDRANAAADKAQGIAAGQALISGGDTTIAQQGTADNAVKNGIVANYDDTKYLASLVPQTDASKKYDQNDPKSDAFEYLKNATPEQMKSVSDSINAIQDPVLKKQYSDALNINNKQIAYQNATSGAYVATTKDSNGNTVNSDGTELTPEQLKLQQIDINDPQYANLSDAAIRQKLNNTVSDLSSKASSGDDNARSQLMLLQSGQKDTDRFNRDVSDATLHQNDLDNHQTQYQILKDFADSQNAKGIPTSASLQTMLNSQYSADNIAQIDAQKAVKANEEKLALAQAKLLDENTRNGNAAIKMKQDSADKIVTVIQDVLKNPGKGNASPSGDSEVNGINKLNIPSDVPAAIKQQIFGQYIQNLKIMSPENASKLAELSLDKKDGIGKEPNTYSYNADMSHLSPETLAAMQLQVSKGGDAAAIGKQITKTITSSGNQNLAGYDIGVRTTNPEIENLKREIAYGKMTVQDRRADQINKIDQHNAFLSGESPTDLSVAPDKYTKSLSDAQAQADKDNAAFAKTLSGTGLNLDGSSSADYSSVKSAGLKDGYGQKSGAFSAAVDTIMPREGSGGKVYPDGDHRPALDGGVSVLNFNAWAQKNNIPMNKVDDTYGTKLDATQQQYLNKYVASVINGEVRTVIGYAGNKSSNVPDRTIAAITSGMHQYGAGHDEFRKITNAVANGRYDDAIGYAKAISGTDGLMRDKFPNRYNDLIAGINYAKNNPIVPAVATKDSTTSDSKSTKYKNHDLSTIHDPYYDDPSNKQYIDSLQSDLANGKELTTSEKNTLLVHQANENKFKSLQQKLDSGIHLSSDESNKLNDYNYNRRDLLSTASHIASSPIRWLNNGLFKVGDTITDMTGSLASTISPSFENNRQNEYNRIANEIRTTYPKISSSDLDKKVKDKMNFMYLFPK